MKTPLTCLPPFFIYFPTPLLHPPMFLLLCFIGWMCDHLMCYFTYWYDGPALVTPRNLSIRSTLQCFMQQWATFTVGLTHKVWFLLIFWFDMTHTQRHIHIHTHKYTHHTHTQRPIDWNRHRYILTPAVIRSH